ncbi:hypothetical protein RFI_26430 [Reticulomyxa filosa]|uniref:Uncharacterized protein n=1 Tax=Reticulomyxa filosa TaxID=46433 RepID=X6MAD0_RETFI|nr:hypothetical protein RFI_26430 [Reticulomyxa filosa]|eukprot:ETO10948.1 hypothetical protein RFI_26430 [Reticulomyxa filosa]
MEEKYPEETRVNETSKISATNKKLKRYYQSQNKLIPLFDDLGQHIDLLHSIGSFDSAATIHIPLRKIVNLFHHINDDDDKSNNDIEYLWSAVINELHISQWDTDDTKYIIYSTNELLLLDGFDEIQMKLKKTTF